MLQVAGIVALAVAMLVTIYDLRLSLAPETCSECAHCRARIQAEAQLQEQLAREYARKNGFDQDDDDRRIG